MSQQDHGDQQLTHVDKQHPYVVMTVCTGNICRSPMAEIVLRNEFAARGLSDVVVVRSCGVSDEEYGNPIDRRAQRELTARGYCLPQNHFAHRITREEIEQTNLFLPMTASHMRSLVRLLPQQRRCDVHMYRSFDTSLPTCEVGREALLDLADPWYGGAHEFKVALDQVEDAAPYIVDWVQSHITQD